MSWSNACDHGIYSEEQWKQEQQWKREAEEQREYGEVERQRKIARQHEEENWKAEREVIENRKRRQRQQNSINSSNSHYFNDSYNCVDDYFSNPKFGSELKRNNYYEETTVLDGGNTRIHRRITVTRIKE